MKYIVSFLLLPIVLTAEKIDYHAPGKVRQTTFEACKVDLSPGEKYFTAKRQWQGCPTILCTPRGHSMPAGIPAASARACSITVFSHEAKTGDSLGHGNRF